MKRPRSSPMLVGLAATALVAGLSGCASLASPAIITKPYQAADGTNFRLPDTPVHLANFLVVGTKKGEPASVIGSVVNGGTSAVQISLSASGTTGESAPTTVEVPAGGSTAIGPDRDTSITLPELSVEPGAQLTMKATTTTSGSSDFNVPVVRPVGYYASLTPSPTPSPTPRARRSSAGTGGSTGSSADASAEPTASATS